MKIIIIGGSIAGLLTGIALKEQGFSVEIYERSAGDMRGRGAGLVLQPDIQEYTAGLAGVTAHTRQILDERGRAVMTYPNDSMFTSWSALWQNLKERFPDRDYHFGYELSSIADMTVYFQNGEQRSADLIIGADGYQSAVRPYVEPGVHPAYAGYVAYRGLIKEDADFFADKFTLYSYEGSHLLSYMIPGGWLNWVWYQNKTSEELAQLLTDKDNRKRDFSVPEGMMSNENRIQLYRDARIYLPKVLADRVVRTDNPFLQAITDMSVHRMYKGRVVILGDAAFVVRPHTASGAAKAFRDALSLAGYLKEYDVDQALAYWNEQQVMHAQSLVKYGQRLAAGSQLGV
jgi:2-polyprenyl-6-methoxyphenol hydroxylase-like FAD-dependent oxidoreductase